MKMKIKILKQFGAAIVAVCVFYGVIVTAYRSYENVQAAQVEVPAAVVVADTTASSEMMTTTPVSAATTAVTPAVTTAAAETAATQATTLTAAATTTTTTNSASSAAATATTVEAVPAKEEEIVPAVDNTASTQTTIETQPAPTVPTLSEFLSQLRCGGCGRNCSLLNPRCGTGASKAQQAQTEYYATYS
jgi:hypothetical protein